MFLRTPSVSLWCWFSMMLLMIGHSLASNGYLEKMTKAAGKYQSALVHRQFNQQPKRKKTKKINFCTNKVTDFHHVFTRRERYMRGAGRKTVLSKGIQTAERASSQQTGEHLFGL